MPNVILTAPTDGQNPLGENLYTVATTLAVGEFFSGMCWILTLQMIIMHGVKGAGITKDKNRQILANLVCFIGCTATTFVYGFNTTKISIGTSNAIICVIFTCIQYSLVIMNHNSIIRFGTMISDNFSHHREWVDRCCKVLYILPWLVFVPVYQAIQKDWIEANGTMKENIKASSFTNMYYKTTSTALIFITHFFAIATDIMLLQKVVASRKEIARKAETVAFQTSKTMQKLQIRDHLSNEMMAYYILIWLMVVFDVVIKIMVVLDLYMMFDSILTIFTIAIRCRTNLQYGLDLKHIFNVSSNGSSSDHASHRPVSTPGKAEKGQFLPTHSSIQKPSDSSRTEHSNVERV